jgi:hypothetical protein
MPDTGACTPRCHRESEQLEALRRDMLAHGLRIGVQSACALAAQRSDVDNTVVVRMQYPVGSV